MLREVPHADLDAVRAVLDMDKGARDKVTSSYLLNGSTEKVVEIACSTAAKAAAHERQLACVDPAALCGEYEDHGDSTTHIYRAQGTYWYSNPLTNGGRPMKLSSAMTVKLVAVVS